MSALHALVIDDNSDNRGVLAELLEVEGVSTTQVRDPLTLESVLAQVGDVDLVFLDLEMPGLNGYEILDQLKSTAAFEHTPVIAYTVHVSEINAARQRGFHSFLGKPLDADNFPAQLASILNGERVWSVG
jgi:CheY-like chemotaxis protein